MMTRETKAGILVSCSFLCLVGIVLFSKLNEKEQAAASADKDDSGWVKAPDEPQPAESPENTPNPDPSKEPPRLMLTAGQDAPPVKNTETATDTTKPTPPAAAATPPKTNVPKFEGWPPVTTTPAPKMASTQPEKKQSSEIVAPILDIPPAKDPKTPAFSTIKPEDKKPAETRAQEKPLVQIPAPPPPAPGLVSTPATPAPQSKKNWWDDDPKGDLKGDAKAAPSNTAASSSPNSIVPAQPAPAFGNSSTTTASNPPKTDPAPDWSKPFDPKKDPAPAAAGDAFANRPVVSTPIDKGPTPTFNMAANPLPASQAPQTAPPPIVAPVQPSSPPIRVSAPTSNSPSVESYDEETFTCRGNDSFQTISQNFFQSDRYARALMLFNRDHPLANSAIKNDPPVLQAGQQLFIPPARILEKYYAAAIDSKTPAAPAIPTGTRVGILGGSETPAPPPASAVRADTASTYRVAGNGEMIRDIARRTLGDAERWPEIYRLNPNIDPKEAVPAGSELRLPSAGAGSS